MYPLLTRAVVNESIEPALNVLCAFQLESQKMLWMCGEATANPKFLSRRFGGAPAHACGASASAATAAATTIAPTRRPNSTQLTSAPFAVTRPHPLILEPATTSSNHRERRAPPPPARGP